MSEWNQQVRDSDRQAAIQAVESACALGRIVQVDRDLRVEQLRQAQTSDEVQMIIHDLPHRAADAEDVQGPAPDSWPAYQPSSSAHDEVAETPPQPPDAQPPYGAPEPTATFTGASGGGARTAKVVVPLILAIVGIGVAASVIAAFNGASNTLDDMVDDFEVGGPRPQRPPDVLSVGGYDDVVAAVRKETGSSEVFEIVIYPEYAVIDVPVDKTSGRERSLYWDGALSESGSKSTTDYDRFDLADLDPAVMDRLAKRARTLLTGKIESNYVIIRAPQESDEGIWFYAYANNEYNEGGYLAANEAGKVLRRVTY